MDLQDDIDRWPEIATSCTGAAGAARIAAQAGVKRLVLVHLDSTADDPNRQTAMLAEAVPSSPATSSSARTSSKSPSPPDEQLQPRLATARPPFFLPLPLETFAKLPGPRMCGCSYSLSLWERVWGEGLPGTHSRVTQRSPLGEGRGEGLPVEAMRVATTRSFPAIGRSRSRCL